MNERLDKFMKIDELKDVKGFCEELVKTEVEFKEELRNEFKFSQKEYNVFGAKKFWLGKIGNWYFVGSEGQKGNEFKFFRNKKMIQMYLTREFEGLEQEQKGFWMQEVEKF